MRAPRGDSFEDRAHSEERMLCMLCNAYLFGGIFPGYWLRLQI